MNSLSKSFSVILLAVSLSFSALNLTGVVVDSITQTTLDSVKICLDLDPNTCIYSDSLGRFHFNYPPISTEYRQVQAAIPALSVACSRNQIRISGPSQSSGCIILNDAAGRIILNKPFSIQEKMVRVDLHKPLCNGLYVLTIAAGNRQYRSTICLVDRQASWTTGPHPGITAMPKAVGAAEVLSLRVSRKGYISKVYTPKSDTAALLKIELMRDNSGIMVVLTNAQRLAPLGENRDLITATSDSIQGDFRYTYEKHDVVDNIQSITYLGLNDDLIWPGSIVKGEHAHDFVYQPASVARNPLTLSLSLETSTTGERITQRVIDPKLSTIRQGISDLLKAAIVDSTSVPAKVEFSYSQVFNESQMDMVVGADVSYGSGSLNTKFDWTAQTKSTRIIAKYKQIYYSVDMDAPLQPSDFFAPSVTPQDLTLALPPGSRPLYVAGVNYGMMAYMFIESDFEYEKMALAIDAAYKGTVDLKVNFNMTAKEMLQKSSIKVVVYGGSTAGLGELETGYDGFLKVIKASKNFSATSPGVPLLYKFRHVIDNTLALVTLTSQYTLIKPLRIRQKVQITAKRFVCEMADDEGAGNDPDMDRFNVYVNAYCRAKSTDAPVQINPVNQSVYAWSVGDWVTMGVGAVHEANQSIILTFDTERYSFPLSELAIFAYARDYDDMSANEQATNSIRINGNQFLDNGGLHNIYLYSADFTFRTEVTVRLVD